MDLISQKLPAAFFFHLIIRQGSSQRGQKTPMSTNSYLWLVSGFLDGQWILYINSKIFFIIKYILWKLPYLMSCMLWRRFRLGWPFSCCANHPDQLWLVQEQFMLKTMSLLFHQGMQSSQKTVWQHSFIAGQRVVFYLVW